MKLLFLLSLIYIIFLKIQEKYLEKLIEEATKQPSCPKCGSRCYECLDINQSAMLSMANFYKPNLQKITVHHNQCLDCGRCWKQKYISK